MSDFWTSIGEAGHLALYLGGLSVLAVLCDYLSKKSGILGAIGGLLKKLVDFFSANLQHK